jgi:hypothetical protein
VSPASDAASPDVSGCAGAGGAGGSAGVTEGSGAVAGSGAAASLAADSSDPPPNKRFNQLVMVAMLQGRADARL